MNKKLILLFLIYNLGYSIQNPQDNFYYRDNTQPSSSQGRFVPSFTNGRSTYLDRGLRNQPAAADSYQEQTLFIGNENRNQDTTPNYYSSFHPSFATTRHSDAFEISPRPFSFGSNPNGLQYTRSPALVANNPAGGYSGRNVPSRLSNARAPLQAGTEKTNAYIGQRAGPSGTSAFTPSTPYTEQRGFAFGNTSNRNKNPFRPSNDYYSSQEDYRNGNSNRNNNNNNNNKFRPLSTEQTATAKTKPTRRNRFSPSSKPPAQIPTTERIINRPNKPVYQSKQPTSSEIVSNEFPSQPSSRYFVKPLNTGAINITHNGSSKVRDASYEENVDEVLLDENYDYVIEKKNNGNEVYDSNVSTSTNNPLVNVDHEYVEFSRVVTTTTAAPIELDVRNQSGENKIVDLGEHTVILTDNFYLPKDESAGDSMAASSEYDSEASTEPIEYEYEYEDYSEEDTEQPTTIEAVTEQATDFQPVLLESDKFENSTEVVDISDESAISSNTEILGEQVISVVTTKSVENSTIMDESAEDKPENLQLAPELETIVNSDTNNTTESWVVVASVQTSRSVSGARFLPFPSVEQDEKKQTLAELERDSVEVKVHENDDIPVTQSSAEITTMPMLSENGEEEDVTIISEVMSSSSKPVVSQSTESIIDKLDRVQSELSIGLLSGKFPILKDMNENTETSTKAPPNGQPLFRKYTTQKSIGVPSTTTKRPYQREGLSEEVIEDLLPPGYKSKNQGAFKNRKSTTTTATPEVENLRPARNQTNTRSFKNNAVAQDITLAGLLPKGYKPPVESDSAEQSTPPKLNELLKKISFEDNVEKLLPPGFKQQNVHPASTSTTAAPVTKKTLGFVTISEDVDKFLPPGFRQNSYSNKKRPFPTTESPKKFVPHGHTPTTSAPKTTTEFNKPQLASLPIIPISDNIDKFLPPGYTPKEKQLQKPTVIALNEDLSVSKLLPPGYKNKKQDSTEDKSAEIKEPDAILSKIPFKEVVNLLPPGFELNDSDTDAPAASTTTTTTTAKPKVVLIGKVPGLTALISHRKPGQRTTTTHKPSAAGDHTTSAPGVTDIQIRKGPPKRVTTEFTGWPSPPTTPYSIDKLLELQKAQAIDITDLLNIPGGPSTSSTSTSTTTTTTTTTTVKPTTPGYCRIECNLAGTIKIIDGVSWKPELLDHNTDEWQNLASEVEIQLNEVYSSDRDLSQWYKGVRIDSFSKGSVLVDYWIELVNITGEVNTLEIKRLFHDALVPSPIKKVEINTSRLIENGTDSEYYETISEPQNTRNNLLLGKFIVDPVSTDFIVLPKSNNPTVGYADNDDFLPQWAVAVLVIGIGSLLFVILFGVTVIISRQNRAKKQPTPLTVDMLNELNKNHMGGLENYEQEEFYNIDDAWENSQKHNNIKPKQRFTNSMHGSSASNIYDSWRSQHRHGGHHNNPNPQHPEYYYDDQNNYISQKNGPYPPDDYAVENHHRNAMSMYTYNPRRLTRNDYDLDF